MLLLRVGIVGSCVVGRVDRWLLGHGAVPPRLLVGEASALAWTSNLGVAILRVVHREPVVGVVVLKLFLLLFWLVFKHFFHVSNSLLSFLLLGSQFFEKLLLIGAHLLGFLHLDDGFVLLLGQFKRLF